MLSVLATRKSISDDLSTTRNEVTQERTCMKKPRELDEVLSRAN